MLKTSFFLILDFGRSPPSRPSYISMNLKKIMQGSTCVSDSFIKPWRPTFWSRPMASETLAAANCFALIIRYPIQIYCLCHLQTNCGCKNPVSDLIGYSCYSLQASEVEQLLAKVATLRKLSMTSHCSYFALLRDQCKRTFRSQNVGKCCN